MHRLIGNAGVAFVTGAGKGLGRATAMHLAQKGIGVAIVDLDEELVKNTVDEINVLCGAKSSRALACAGDVTSEEDMQRCIEATLSVFGRIDVNVNCAGIAPPKRVLSKRGVHPLKLFADVMNVNTVGTFNCARLTAEQMANNDPDEDGQRGLIINTASVAAFDGQIGQAAYAASKGAVAAMTLPLARDLSTSGVRVCTIAPGLFSTPMMEALPESVRVDLAATTPFPKRLGNPVEYAKLVESIIDNTMLNGETIRLDGSIRMQA